MNERRFMVELPIDVKPYEIDAVGHVSNIVYIKWLEDGRLRMLDEYLPFEELMKEDLSPVLIKTEIQYKRAIKLFDKLSLFCWITKVEGIRMEMEFEFIANDKIASTAKQEGIFFNVKTNRPSRPPKRFMEIYNG